MALLHDHCNKIAMVNQESERHRQNDQPKDHIEIRFTPLPLANRAGYEAAIRWLAGLLAEAISQQVDTGSPPPYSTSTAQAPQLAVRPNQKESSMDPDGSWLDHE